ncbi:2-oxo acid dehydrogenase subunit E2 [Paeniglutamicibacter antarcticus]|uniref:Dihydrolipoamide acetyltransferase component of pyruvate dehydrogenase complex n=1 Tax=Arthrobacter terrae TaxID=2935737 RepID=A0A931CTJ4_9MICC|nr:dihydrolipoamide acetyltransferase family protein [Arthrobacter terrae]MBG0739538.1 2-oxo acid dehydrogenase subunit E2 [Arthrobacter terrae]
MPEVVMPRLSDTMEEGILSRWLKKEGDAVRQGDVIGEIDTDKATMELESFDDGILEKLLVQEGTTVAIGQPLAVIGNGTGSPGPASTGDGTATATAAAAAPDGTAPEMMTAPAPDPAVPAPLPSKTVAASDHAQPDAGSQRLLSSPLARREAARHGLNPATIIGTGPGGRIVRADVEAAIAAAEAAPSRPERQAQQTGPGAQAEQPPSSAPESVEVPLTRMRKVTARRLTESAAVPHFYLTVVVGVDALFRFRREVNERFADQGLKVSVTDLLVRACAVTLRSYPQVNSSWGEDSIFAHRRINIGVAVALDDGLIVPVVTDADARSLDQTAAETRSLAEKARAGTLKLKELSGGTFTISNLGMFGIDNFTAVINPPEAAILAVGAATKEPFLQDGELRSRSIMKITMTSDHRVLDGATSAAFLRDLKRTLEEPLRMVL